MSTVVVIYFSATGVTERLATAICEGASTLTDAATHRIAGSEIIDGRFRNEAALKLVDSADAVVFGSPTYMGGPAAQFKAFADATGDRWSERTWAHKVAAGFTTGTCANGDQGHTLAYFAVLAAQHGMIWCNLDIPGGYDPQNRNRLGTQMGVSSQQVEGSLPAADLLTAQHLGQQVASLALRLAVSRRYPLGGQESAA